MAVRVVQDFRLEIVGEVRNKKRGDISYPSVQGSKFIDHRSAKLSIVRNIKEIYNGCDKTIV